ncbi:type 1 glutamine amidotransferase [Rhizobium cauense]|uniref:type 1 glutamine amidotransferase n=1 Tax=Rhizobium cauense TaxID=1166683 RepID=UPI001C6ECBAD|nr:type 1 glutamine amidotransferase [Rhizobium cauense]MBW9112521.1 type 1 glutamine amidotransferase [Rhizobium cauense]
MRVAVIENMKSTPLGSLGTALSEVNAEVERFRPWIDGKLPTGSADHDALVVLGGEQNAIDDANYPYLPALAQLMRDFAEADKAVLGICLGAQILARAYGAENQLNARLEFGWHSVSKSVEGQTDPLLSGLADDFTTFQWHSDTFTLPIGATRLAASNLAQNQAFRIGRAAYGTQFHFEASASVIDSWKGEFAASIEQMEPGWHERYEALAAAHAAAWDASGLAIGRNWVRMIRAEARLELKGAVASR